MSASRRSSALVILSLLASYVAGYGVMRWRKILVRNEYRVDKGIGPLIIEIRAGHDLRESGVGGFKNGVAEPVAAVYTPLRWLEAVCWELKRSDES